MSKSEQEDATQSAVKDLEDHREMKKLAVRNVPLEAFHDCQKSVGAIDREVFCFCCLSRDMCSDAKFY